MDLMLFLHVTSLIPFWNLGVFGLIIRVSSEMKKAIGAYSLERSLITLY